MVESRRVVLPEPEPETPTPPAPVSEPVPYREAMPSEVSSAIAAVMKDAGYVQKRGWNDEHKYRYVAIGDLLVKLQLGMSNAGLVIIQDEGALMFPGTDKGVAGIKYSFTLHVNGVSWPKHKPIEKTGMSRFQFRSGSIDDKFMNKCATTARKYFLLELFQVPSGELSEPDATGEDRGATGEDRGADNRNTGNGRDDGLPESVMNGGGDPRPVPPSKDERRQNAENWQRNAMTDLDECKTSDDLFHWETNNSDTLTKLFRNHPDLHKPLVEKLRARSEAIG